MKKENHIENRIEQLIREERNTELNPYLVYQGDGSDCETAGSKSQLCCQCS
jgi:hypothetical protein